MTLPPDFPWRRSMTAILPDGTRTLVLRADAEEVETEDMIYEVDTRRHLRPDPDDGATLGALLAEVRRKHGLPDLYVKPLLPGGWTVTRPFTVPTILWEEQWGLTEFDALLAAWNARPRSSHRRRARVPPRPPSSSTSARPRSRATAGARWSRGATRPKW